MELINAKQAAIRSNEAYQEELNAQNEFYDVQKEEVIKIIESAIARGTKVNSFDLVVPLCTKLIYELKEKGYCLTKSKVIENGWIITWY
jgi:hypothetical protein